MPSDPVCLPVKVRDYGGPSTTDEEDNLKLKKIGVWKCGTAAGSVTSALFSVIFTKQEDVNCMTY